MEDDINIKVILMNGPGSVLINIILPTDLETLQTQRNNAEHSDLQATASSINSLSSNKSDYSVIAI